MDTDSWVENGLPLQVGISACRHDWNCIKWPFEKFQNIWIKKQDPCLCLGFAVSLAFMGLKVSKLRVLDINQHDGSVYRNRRISLSGKF